jgi:hypothetical protein
MSTNKFLLASLAATLVYFFVGYLAYGVLLSNFFATHAGPAKDVARDMDHLLFMYIILGNLFSGFLLAYIFSKAKIATISRGVITGAIVGFLMSASHDCISYATSWMISRSSLLADVIVFSILSAIAGAIIALIAGKGKKS